MAQLSGAVAEEIVVIWCVSKCRTKQTGLVDSCVMLHFAPECHCQVLNCAGAVHVSSVVVHEAPGKQMADGVHLSVVVTRVKPDWIIPLCLANTTSNLYGLEKSGSFANLIMRCPCWTRGICQWAMTHVLHCGAGSARQFQGKRCLQWFCSV